MAAATPLEVEGTRERAPFIGPRPFEISEPLFFGRARETSTLVSLLLAHRVVLLTAPSGAGKTSLIQAGLIPELTASSAARAPRFIRCNVGRVSGATKPRAGNVYLANVLSWWAPQDHVPATAEGLRAWLLQDEAAGRKLLVIDQLEELLTTNAAHWAQRREFLDILFQALFEDAELDDDADDLDGEARKQRSADRRKMLEKLKSFRLLLVIREDYVGELDRVSSSVATRLGTRMKLGFLDRASAKMAIKEPLSACGGTIEEAAVDRLVAQLSTRFENVDGLQRTAVEGESIEPLQLQVVCSRLWQAFGRRTITLADINLGSVSAVLRELYEEAVAAVAVAHKVSESKIRDWFEQKLITSGGTRAQVVQDRDAVANLPRVAAEMFATRFPLLRTEQRAGARWFELTHDQLIEPIRESNRRARLKREATTLRRVSALAVIFGAVAITVFSILSSKLEQKRSQGVDEAGKITAGERLEAALTTALAYEREQATAARAEAQKLTALLDEQKAACLQQIETLPVKNREAAAGQAADVLDKLTQGRVNVSPPATPRDQARRYWNIGFDAQEQRKVIKAGEAFRKAIEADPTYAPAYNSLGIIEQNNGNALEAERHFRRAIKEWPDYRPSYVNLAQLLFLKGELEEAEKHAKHAAEDGSTTSKRLLKRIEDAREDRSSLFSQIGASKKP